MVRVVFVFILIICVFISVDGQKFGFSYGRSGYIGDLSTQDFNYYKKSNRSAYGVFAELPLSDKFDVVARLGITNISGADSLSSEPSVLVRNQNFRNQLYELDASFKYSIIQFGKSKFYAKLGLGVASHGPRSEFKGQTYSLRELNTEGQTLARYPDRYKSVIVIVPAGFGLEFPLSNNINGFVEGVARWTNFDYLDDVSGFYAPYDDLLANFGLLSADIADRTPNQVSRTEAMAVRGNPDSNDYYFTFNLGLIFRLKDQNESVLCPQF